MQILCCVSLIFLFHLYSYYSGIVETKSESYIRRQWEEYKRKYNQIFNGMEEENRFKIFVKNTKHIKKLNAKNTGTVYGMNKFGHWTDEEFMDYVNQGAKFIKKSDYFDSIYTPSKQNYSDIDWREKGVVTDIKDQLKCRSSYAFSTAAQLETQYAMIKNKTIILSEQDIVDCSKKFGNEGCNGGFSDLAYEYVQQKGISSNEDYPYVGMDLKCKHKEKKSILKVKGIHSLPKGNEDELSSALSNFGPISVGYAATQDLKFYKSGVYFDKYCFPSRINHAMLVVGLGSKPSLHYIVKNSWGTSWGMNGYLLTARDQKNMCGIATQAMYSTVDIQN